MLSPLYLQTKMNVLLTMVAASTFARTLLVATNVPARMASPFTRINMTARRVSQSESTSFALPESNHKGLCLYTYLGHPPYHLLMVLFHSDTNV